MRNMYIYYLLVFLPAPLLYWIAREGNPILFLIALTAYGFVYRPIIDANRLIAKGCIRKDQFWEIFNPNSQFKYFRQLFF